MERDRSLVQAYVNMVTNGSNRRLFAPDALRDIAPAEKLGAEPATYVKLDGLGKIAYSSIKRPRPLMDLVATPVKTGVRDLFCLLTPCFAGGEENRQRQPRQEETTPCKIPTWGRVGSGWGGCYMLAAHNGRYGSMHLERS